MSARRNPSEHIAMEHSPSSARDTRDRQPLIDPESREQGCGKQRKIELTGKGGGSNLLRLGVGLIVTFAYVMFGAAVMVCLEPNDFDWLSAMHFCAVTITAVGYGDEVPHTPLSKAFIVCYILVWISCITTVAGSYIASAVRQWHQATHTVLSKRPLQWDIAMHVLMVLVLLLVGSIAFMLAEGENFLNSFYWTVVTLATVGYGDYVQHSRESKLFGLFFILIGVVWFAAALSGIVRAMVEIQLLNRLNEVAEVGVTADLLVAMDGNANGLVERDEFVLLALLQHGLVNPEDVQHMHVLFDSLDEDRNGVLTVADVRGRVRAKKRC